MVSLVVGVGVVSGSLHLFNNTACVYENEGPSFSCHLAASREARAVHSTAEGRMSY